MGGKGLTRRAVLRTAALATTTLAAPFGRGACAAGKVVPGGSMVLAWHTNIAPRWLDPLQHDGGATPDNFLNVVQDGLIKNFREKLFDHLGSCRALRVCRGRQKRHVPTSLRPQVSQWRCGHARRMSSGATSTTTAPGPQVLHDRTDGVEISDERTIRFNFKEPFLDFPRLIGTANVCGAGWVVPAKYYQEVGQEGFRQKPDRCRALQAGGPGAGYQARIRGLRRLLPAGSHKEIHDRQRDRCGDTGGDARARRGGHNLLHPGRAGRARTERSEDDAGAGGLGQLVARIPRLSGPEEPVPRQARARGDQPYDRSGRHESSRVRRVSAGSTEIGSMTMSNTGSNGRNGSTTLPKQSN